MKVSFTFVKSTKNFHKFEAVAPMLGSIYIPVSQMPVPQKTLELMQPLKVAA